MMTTRHMAIGKTLPFCYRHLPPALPRVSEGRGRVLYVVNLVLAYAISVAFAACAAMLLPIRRPAPYWIVVATQIPVSLLKYSFSVDITFVNVAFFMLYFAIVPMLFWDASVAVRATCAAIVVALGVAIECISGVFYYYMGFTVGRIALADDASMVLLRVVYIAALLAAGAVLAPYTRRMAKSVPATRRSGAVYISIILLQAVLLLMFLFAPSIGGIQDMRHLAHQVPAVVASMVAMLIGLRSIRRSVEARVERAAAHAYEERLDAYLASMRDRIDAAEDAARFRHDHRNHLTVIRRLIEAGEVGAARQYVGDLRSAIEGGERP